MLPDAPQPQPPTETPASRLPSYPPPPPAPPVLAERRGPLMALIAGVSVASIAFRFAQGVGWEHSAFVFVGIPALLAVAVAMAPRPGSATGVAMKSTALALLLAGILFGEAFICILMASPIFFLLAGLAGKGIDVAERRRRRKLPANEERMGAAPAAALVLIVAAIPAMEGVVPWFAFDRDEEVTVVRVIDAAPSDVEAALAAPLRFDAPLPRFLRLGFPTPGAASGAGLRVGDERRVEMAHGHHPGTLVMRVTESAPGRAVFTPVSDDTYIVHWLSWRNAEVAWRPVAGGTEVTWTLRYRRRLDPAWYFGPLERHGVGVAGGYLIDALATPPARP